MALLGSFVSLGRYLAYAFLGLVCSQFQAEIAAARTLHVPAEFVTIQHGLDAAAVGDTVLVGPGTYTGSGNRDLDFAGKNLVLRAAAGAASTVIDCMASASSPARAIRFHSGEDHAAVVEGFTLQNGFAVDYGGGILCDNASPRIVACVIANNSTAHSGDGAGIACFFSTASVEGCVLRGNQAVLGAGGGMLLSHSNVALADCVFEANQGVWGCGLYCEMSRAGLDRCTFLANEGVFDGALACAGLSTVAVRACTFAFNVTSAADQAGGLGVSRNSSATLQATIIAFSAQGCGVSCDAGSMVALVCCDLFQNAGGDWVGCVADQAGANGNFTADPYFCDPVVDDLHLRNDSPCLPGQHPGGATCGLIGAHGMGTCVSPVRPVSWSAVKTRYR